jgi:hypothetical protein
MRHYAVKAADERKLLAAGVLWLKASSIHDKELKMRNIILALFAVVALDLLAACSGNGATSNSSLPSVASQSASNSWATPPTEAEFESWQLMIQRVPRPENTCSTAAFPETAWREIRCVTPPNDPFLPANGIRAATVGNGNDWSLAVTGHSSFAQGSFHHVSGVKTEEQNGKSNDYSLQLNTQPFTTATCATLGSPDPSDCRGWEQFIYATSGSSAVAFIQYWLLHFGPAGTACPSGWHSHGKTEISCFINSKHGAPAPAEAITNLGNLLLYGNAAVAPGSTDSVGFTVFGSSVYAVDGDNHFPDLDLGWQKSEFNIFGNCCANQAVFNTGSQAVVRLESDSGAIAAPTCDAQGFTGETNNLYLVGESTSWPDVQYPSIVFTESNAAKRSAKSCVVEPAR